MAWREVPHRPELFQRVALTQRPPTFRPLQWFKWQRRAKQTRPNRRRHSSPLRATSPSRSRRQMPTWNSAPLKLFVQASPAQAIPILPCAGPLAEPRARRRAEVSTSAATTPPRACSLRLPQPPLRHRASLMPRSKPQPSSTSPAISLCK